MALEQMFHQFKWTKSQLLYEKTFWESELREAGFCKLLMNGLYLRSVEKKWDLKMEARIVPSSPHDSSERKSILKNHLIDAVGINYGGGGPTFFSCFLCDGCVICALFGIFIMKFWVTGVIAVCFYSLFIIDAAKHEFVRL